MSGVQTSSHNAVEWKRSPVKVHTPIMLSVDSTGLATLPTTLYDQSEELRENSFAKIMRESASLMFADEVQLDPHLHLIPESNDIIEYENTIEDGDTSPIDSAFGTHLKPTDWIAAHPHVSHTAVSSSGTLIPNKFSSTSYAENSSVDRADNTAAFLRDMYENLLSIEKRIPSDLVIPNFTDIAIESDASMDSFLAKV